MIYHFQCYFFLCVECISIWHHFPLAWRAPVNISYSIILMVMNSFSFCKSEKKYSFAITVKWYFFFTVYGILGCQFYFVFHFYKLKIFPHFLITCILSNKKSAVILNFVFHMLLVFFFLIFSACFSDFLYPGFYAIWLKCSLQSSLSFLCLEFVELLGSMNV